MATLHDIAAKAKFSVSTVSRVLNNKSEQFRISKEAQDQIIAAAEELNYKPNRLARGLRLKRTHTIGMVVPDISNPFFSYETRIIQEFASQMGYSLIVCNTNEDIEVEIEQIELLQSKGVDGILLMPIGSKSAHIEQLIKDEFPLVLLDRVIKNLSTDSVVVANYTGAFNAVEHLIEHGHEQIAVIKGSDTYTSSERVRGYYEALNKHKIPINPSYVVGSDFSKENGYIQTKLLMHLDKAPTALFTVSDRITLGALQAIVEEKLNVPEDISIVSFDDIDFAPFLFTPLTTVSQPRELIGKLAVNLLVKNINEIDSKKNQIVLNPKLLIRDSVKSMQKLITEG